jgi:GNAT superfamily N-acetyltransferase
VISLSSELPGQATLLACWASLTQLSAGARLVDSPWAHTAVFPAWVPLNNAILRHAEDSQARSAAVAAVRDVYAESGVEAWAVWVPSQVTDLDAPDPVPEIAGLERDTTTLVMQRSLSADLRATGIVRRTSVATATRATDAEVPVADLAPPDGLPGLSAWVLVHGEAAVAGAWSFLHDEDCGIFTVGTAPAGRRHGFARALVEHVLADAWGSGARTATLQSTRMGQPLYERLGFTAAGRYEEWVPGHGKLLPC